MKQINHDPYRPLNPVPTARLLAKDSALKSDVLELLQRAILDWFMWEQYLRRSHSRKMSDYKPRKDELLLKGYLAGRYDAVVFWPHNLSELAE